MTNSTPDENRTVESTDEIEIAPEVLAESIRNKTSAINSHGDVLAEKLERLGEREADAESGLTSDGTTPTIDTAPVMTELLETASDLIAVAHKLESARTHE